MKPPSFVFIAAVTVIATSASSQSALTQGTRLTAGKTQFEVVSIEDHGTYATYALESEGGDVCGRADGAAVPAIPLDGHWDETMKWHPGGLTLACTNGPIGKCVVWGYRPWEAGMRDVHQACVRMVRADYCGTGVGQTRDGTPIDVWDRKGILAPANVPDMTFEADWSPAGATRIRRTRFPAGMAYVQRVCPERLEANGATPEIAPLSNASFP